MRLPSPRIRESDSKGSPAVQAGALAAGETPFACLAVGQVDGHGPMQVAGRPPGQVTGQSAGPRAPALRGQGAEHPGRQWSAAAAVTVTGAGIAATADATGARRGHAMGHVEGQVPGPV